MNRHISTPAHPSRNSAVVRAVTDLFRQVISILRALEHRREVKALAELDERTLKDIGLSPGDVDGALAEPFFRNPSLVLVRRVERRSGREADPVRKAGPRPVVPLVKVAG